MNLAVEPAPPLQRARALELLAAMLRIRRFEERCARLYGEQKIRGFLHLCNGQEAIAVGLIPLLLANDALVATYREHAHALVRGIPMDSLMAEMFGKRTGASRGRGGSMHIFDAKTRFYGGNAIVGAGLPMATGLALAQKMQRDGGITACFFGEGAVAEGEFHESMNLAALWKLPVLFVCENNLYAMGTAVARSEAATDIAAKAAAYAMRSAWVDGMDVLAVEAAAAAAIASVRRGEGPLLLECRTYRLRAHSMYDPQLYRTKEEVLEWQKRGPLIFFTTMAKARGLLTEADFLELQAAAEREVDAAVAFAEASDWEPESMLTRGVYAGQLPA